MKSTLHLAGMHFEELLTLFLCEVSGDDDYYDVLAEILAKADRQLMTLLLDHLSEKRLRAAVFGLGSVESGGAGIADLLKHNNHLIVTEAIDTLRRQGCFLEHVVTDLSKHPSPYVRGAVMRYVKAERGKEALPFLLDGLNDQDPIVKQNALDELDGIATPSELIQICLMLKDENAGVREAAQWLMDNIPPHK